MLKNYLLAAIRNFKKDKTTLIICLTGLSAGMACCMIILIYIQDELSYNQFNSKLDRIYTVNWITKTDGQITTFATTPIVLSPNLSPHIPAIDLAGRMYQRSGEMQVNDNKPVTPSKTRFQEQNVFFADPSIFNIFSIFFIKGDSRSALSSFNTIVITDEMARKYFGQTDPLGKSLLYDNEVMLRVGAVVSKMPENSDIQFDFLISFETLFSIEKKPIADFLRTDWTFNPCYTFVLLKPAQRSGATTPLLNNLLTASGNARTHQLNKIALQPFSDTHLHAASVIGGLSTNSIVYIYIFAGIAFLILVIANVNFINLTTAKSVTRSQEVGMRRLLGAEKPQLIVQFLLETLLLSGFAFLVALVFTQLSLPIMNELTNKQLSWRSWFDPLNLTLFILVFFVVALVAGLYPALYITRINPALSIKGKSGESGKRQFVQKALMVIQFSISLLLISGAMIMYQQLQYLRNKPLGFRKEQMIVLPIFGSGASTIGYGVDGPMRRRMNDFSDELTRYSKISGVTAASAMPGQGYIPGLVIPQGFSGNDNIFVSWASVDYNFIKTFDISVIAGRDFSKSRGTDHLNAFIINESAVHRFGWKGPADAVGKTMIRGEEEGGKKGFVIGVIKDFNFNTLDQPMQPLILDVGAARFTQFAINVQPDHMPETLEFIKGKWNEIFPERVFEYSFLDKDIQALYKDKENLSRIIEYFAGIAILLSALGLFSLASFLSIQRTKEISIRKILGATVPRIILMLSADYLKWVLIAVAVASPISYLIMKKWLQGFAFRISIDAWVFVLAGISALFIAWLTISFHAIKTAMTEPVKNLRVE